MADQTLTLSDMRIDVGTCLKGAGVANVALGETVIDHQLNKAMVRTVIDAPLEEHAGSLYTTASLTPASGTVAQSANVLYPLAVSFTDGKRSVQKKLQELLRIDPTDILCGAKEISYTFAGSNILVRPQVTPIVFHYIKVPPKLESAVDVFPLGAGYYNAVILNAAMSLAFQMAGLAPDILQALMGLYRSALSTLKGEEEEEAMDAALARMAKSAFRAAQ